MSTPAIDINSEEYTSSLITKKILSDAGFENIELTEFEHKRAERELDAMIKRLVK